MRRKDREITDINEMVEIIRRCDVCRLAMNDEEFPYMVPLNFGMDYTDGIIRFYFHSALEGKKMDLLKKNPKVAFEMDCGHQLEYKEEQGYCTMAFESVMGRGTIDFLSEEEKFAALEKLMAQYHLDNKPFDPREIPMTAVYRLTVTEITGKRKVPKFS